MNARPVVPPDLDLALFTAAADADAVRALAEDIATGDVTARLIPALAMMFPCPRPGIPTQRLPRQGSFPTRTPQRPHSRRWFVHRIDQFAVG